MYYIIRILNNSDELETLLLTQNELERIRKRSHQAALPKRITFVQRLRLIWSILWKKQITKSERVTGNFL